MVVVSNIIVSLSLRDLKVAPTDALGLVAVTDVSVSVAAAFRLRLFVLATRPEGRCYRSLDNPRFVRYHIAQQVNLLLSNESNCYHLVYLRRQECIEMSAFRGSCTDTW